MEEKTPKKPAHLPNEAIWDLKMKCWKMGDLDFKKGGFEQYWNKEGVLWHENYRKANGAGWTKRYHPDGTLANHYIYKHHVEDGPVIFQRSKEPSPEFFPERIDDSVWKAVIEFKHHNIIGARYFLGNGKEVPRHGTGEPDKALDELISKSPNELLMAGDF